MYTNLITGNVHSTIRGLLNELRPLNITSKEYYDRFFKKETDGICEVCGKCTKFKWNLSTGRGYKLHCSTACSKRSDLHRSIVSNRFRGVDGEKKLAQFREKRSTYKHSPETIEKLLNTKRKVAESMGITYSDYCSMVGTKGARSVSQESRLESTKRAMETRKNNGHCFSIGKTYDFDLYGDMIKVQGYEPGIFNLLIKDIGIVDLVAGKKFTTPIEYYNPIKQKVCLYYPDGYIPSLNMLIEVKSDYTMRLHAEMTNAKIQNCLSNGYNVMLIILKKSIDKPSVRRNAVLDSLKSMIDWAISSQASNHLYVYDEGSTTREFPVVPSGTKCRDTIIGM